MENKLDKLFKDKLSSYEESPSVKAWDQIQDQLASKRKKLWSRRLAIAASIMLLVSLGYVGFHALETVPVKDGEISSKSMDESTVDESNLTNIPEAGLENNKEKTIDPVIENQEVLAEVKSPEHVAKYPIKPKSEELLRRTETSAIANEEMKNIALAGVENLSEINNVTTEYVQTPMEIPGENSQKVLAEVSSSGQAQVEEYPHVTVIYKAGKESVLVESGRRNILDKGINKISEFSDEYLLTSERKIKLRNTKEDVLALNFGKLINKSNKEFKN